MVTGSADRYQQGGSPGGKLVPEGVEGRVPYRGPVAPVLRFAHTRFRFNWSWNGEEAVILSRCTDERGTVQPSLAEFSKRLGAPKDFWKTSSVFHFNAIQPWRIEKDGRVTDAMEL